MKTINNVLKLFIFNLIIFASTDASNLDIKNVKGYSGDSTKLLGIVKNQSWVTSKTLSENQLKKIIKKYNKFKIISFDELYGILIEYNPSNNDVLEDLEKLKLEPGIYRIFNRVYEGKNAFEINTAF